MPAILYGIGVLALFSGLVMIGFGIPINEFSFGNTLIGAGTTAAVGGLIIIGLGVVAGQLRRLVELLPVSSSGRLSEPEEAPASTATAAARPIPSSGRVPFPAKPKSEPLPGDAIPVSGASAIPFENRLPESFAPTLRNPDESPLAVEDDVSLLPRHPATAAAPTSNDLPRGGRPSPGPALGATAASAPDKNREPTTGWRSMPPPSPPPQSQSLPTANFDAMWPAEAKSPKIEPQSEMRADTLARDAAAVSKRGEGEAQKSHAPAILKSGVVDGMAYTLYVDGSIEAELPQGTLRFASINELRSHLAKNS